METYKVTDDTYVIGSFEPVPGFGLLPINAFLIKGAQPVLIDTHGLTWRDDFMAKLRSLIDPSEIRWLFLTHDDMDHAGSVEPVLNAAPNATLVTCFVGVGKLTAILPPLAPRAYLLNPGQSLDVGDRRIASFLPPLFDSASTMGFYDSRNETLFTADAFGMFVPSPAEELSDVPETAFAEGFSNWNRANHAWSWLVDSSKFQGLLENVRKFQPKALLSSHAPVARGKTDELLKAMAAVPGQGAFVGPDQEAMMAMMARLESGQAPGA